MKTQKHLDFEALVLPLMQWLQENHHPHITVVVNSTYAELLEGKYSAALPLGDPNCNACNEEKR